MTQRPDITRRTALIALGCLLVLNLLLRVFYLRYQFLNGDETIRALTAVRLLDGGTLYVDVVTDKPPGATLFYAAVFALFGRSMTAVHLSAWVWNFLTAAVIYLIGRRFAGRRVGVLAAAIFVYFSTNYFTQDMMAANTELLMALPYTIAFLLFMLAQHDLPERDAEDIQINAVRRYWLSVAAGLMAAAALIFKQVGVFILLFFAVYAAISAYQKSRRDGRKVRLGSMLVAVYEKLAPAGVGVILGVGSLLAWLYFTGALRGFWRYSVRMGAAYVGSLPPGLWLKFMTGRLGGYVLFNAALWMLALWAVIAFVRSRRRSAEHLDTRPGNDGGADGFELSLVSWAAASMLGLFAGGRFFGHYFFALLPALSLLGARGLELMLGELRARRSSHRLVRLAVAVVILSLAIGFYRFHHRTAILAYETLTGTSSRFSESWGMTEREREAEEIARFVRERIGEGEPLYIWGFSLDVYWQSGCRPASRFLTPNYVAGHFYPELSRAEAPGDPFWRDAREQLIDDLRASRPRLILNTDEALYDLPFPEITEFIRDNYVYEGQIGSDPARPFLIFRLREKDKRLKRAPEPGATR